MCTALVLRATLLTATFFCNYRRSQIYFFSSLLQETGRAKLFCSDRYQSDVSVLGGTKEQKGLKSEGGETLLWTIRGGAKITVGKISQRKSTVVLVN